MSNLICKNTMRACQKPGMCAPHGGCKPAAGQLVHPDDHAKLRSDYAALEAENARLRVEISDLHTTMMAAAVEIQEHWAAHCDEGGYGPANLMHRLENGIAAQYGYTAQTLVRIEAERDAALAQLAAIQQAKGEEVEVVGYVNVRNGRRGDWLHRSEADARSHDRTALAGKPAGAEPEPLMTVAQHQRITAAMAAEVERHKLDTLNLKAQRDSALDNMRFAQGECDALRAELAAVKGQEAVAYVTGYYGGRCVVEPANRAAVLPARMVLYALPPASPDVEGLVKVLEAAQKHVEYAAEESDEACELANQISVIISGFQKNN